MSIGKSLSDMFESGKNLLHQKYSKNAGSIILHAGAAGWILSSLAQIVAVSSNSQIPKEQKKFLIPQEALDGAINVLSFYLITKTCKDLGQKLVKTGKWSNKKIIDFIKKEAPDIKIGDMKTDIEKTFEEKFKNDIAGKNNFYKTYGPFKGGIDMITTTIGSIVSCNFLTPALRNYLGAKQQKRSIEHDKKAENITQISKPILYQNRVSMDTFKHQASKKSYYPTGSGQIKI